jgi:hypothetical protein
MSNGSGSGAAPVVNGLTSDWEERLLLLAAHITSSRGRYNFAAPWLPAALVTALAQDDAVFAVFRGHVQRLTGDKGAHQKSVMRLGTSLLDFEPQENRTGLAIYTGAMATTPDSFDWLDWLPGGPTFDWLWWLVPDGRPRLADRSTDSPATGTDS